MSAQENCQEIEEEVCSKCGSDDIQHDDCWSCGGTGGRDWEELQFEDPLWYDEESFVECDVCGGTGIISVCLSCIIRNKVMNKYYTMSIAVATVLQVAPLLKSNPELRILQQNTENAFEKLESPIRSAEVAVRYPLSTQFVVTIPVVETVFDILKAVAYAYRDVIYQEPQKYGVWGHTLEQLYFERVIVTNNQIVVDVGS